MDDEEQLMELRHYDKDLGIVTGACFCGRYSTRSTEAIVRKFMADHWEKHGGARKHLADYAFGRKEEKP